MQTNDKLTDAARKGAESKPTSRRWQQLDTKTQDAIVKRIVSQPSLAEEFVRSYLNVMPQSEFTETLVQLEDDANAEGTSVYHENQKPA